MWALPEPKSSLLKEIVNEVVRAASEAFFAWVTIAKVVRYPSRWRDLLGYGPVGDINPLYEPDVPYFALYDKTKAKGLYTKP